MEKGKVRVQSKYGGEEEEKVERNEEERKYIQKKRKEEKKDGRLIVNKVKFKLIK